MKHYARMLNSLVLVAVFADPVFSQQLAHFEDKSAFLAATGATAEAPMPCEGAWPFQERTVGNLHFSTLVRNCSDSDGHLAFGDSDSPVVRCELGINGCEDLEVTVLDGPAYAMGFEFYEPTVGGGVNSGCPATDSDFNVTVFFGSSLVGTFVFNVPDDDATGFVGVWSAEPFDRIIADELGNTCDDEYYGQFYTSHSPSAPVPAVSVWGLVAMTLLLLTVGTLTVIRRQRFAHQTDALDV